MGHVSRRAILAGAATATVLQRPAIAQPAPLKVGMMLPFSGTYAALGENIAASFELLVAENGGKLAGRPITLIRLDDESDPSKAPANVNRLIERENVDVLLGTVHSGVVMALVQAAREKEIPLFIPNAGNVAATRDLCSVSVFRSSFSNWQPAYGMGKALADAFPAARAIFDEVDAALGIRARAERRAVVEEGASVPLAVPQRLV